MAITCPGDVWSPLTREASAPFVSPIIVLAHLRRCAPRTSRMLSRLKWCQAKSGSYNSHNPRLRGLVTATRMGRAREEEHQSARRPHPMAYTCSRLSTVVFVCSTQRSFGGSFQWSFAGLSTVVCWHFFLVVPCCPSLEREG